jgi:hypothetical protein
LCRHLFFPLFLLMFLYGCIFLLLSSYSCLSFPCFFFRSLFYLFLSTLPFTSNSLSLSFFFISRPLLLFSSFIIYFSVLTFPLT